MPTRRPIGQQLRVAAGGAAATDHGAPGEATKSLPGVVADGPRFLDQLVKGKGGTPPAREGVECHLRSDHPRPTTTFTAARLPFGPAPSRAPSYILSGLRSDQISSENVHVQICHPNGHFFVCEMSIKSRLRAPPVWDPNLTSCVGRDFVVAAVAVGGSGGPAE